MSEHPSFGRLLRDARGESTQDAVCAVLAERGVSITRQALQHWERNRAPAPAVVIGILMDIYRCTPESRLALLEASMVPLAQRPDDVPDGRRSDDADPEARVA